MKGYSCLNESPCLLPPQKIRNHRIPANVWGSKRNRLFMSCSRYLSPQLTPLGLENQDNRSFWISTNCIGNCWCFCETRPFCAVRTYWRVWHGGRELDEIERAPQAESKGLSLRRPAHWVSEFCLTTFSWRRLPKCLLFIERPESIFCMTSPWDSETYLQKGKPAPNSIHWRLRGRS